MFTARTNNKPDQSGAHAARTAWKPQIALNRDAFDKALFTGPRTFDGYVRRIVKGGVRLFIMGENYTLNHDGVFCFETRLESGQTWYSYGGRFNARTSMAERADLAEVIHAMLKGAAK